MTRLAWRRRVRLVGAGVTALALTTGLTVALSAAGGDPGARANPVGGSPGVYVAATGDIDTSSVSSLQAGGTATGADAATEYGPVAINVTATAALVGETFFSADPVPAAVEVVSVASGHRSQPVNLAAPAIGMAMDPANPELAYVLENNDGDVFVERVDMSPPLPTVSLLLDRDQLGDAEPDTIAISPDGQTLYLAGTIPTPGADDDFFGVEAVPVSDPARTITWSAAGRKLPFTDGEINDVALAPDGRFLYAAVTGFDEGPATGVTVALALPLDPTEQVTWSQTVAFDPASVTASPDGETVYVGGPESENPDSVVQALRAADGHAGDAAPIPITVIDEGSVGWISIAISPDGQTLMAAGIDSASQTKVVVYPLHLPSLTIGPATTLSNLTDISGPQALATTPDQAPVSRLTVTPAVAGSPTSFDATASSVLYGSVVSYAWDFGDGTSAITAGPTTTHVYAHSGTYSGVTVTETDSAGTTVPPAPATGAGFAANGPGQTPYQLASPLARSSPQSVAIPASPPATTTTTTTTAPANPTTTAPPRPTTTSTTKPVTATTAPRPVTTTTPARQHRPPAVPALTLNPGLGPPGTVVTVTGTGFPANKQVTVFWSVSTGAVEITADSHGDLPPTSLPILTPDVLGPRYAETSTKPKTTAPFLVVPDNSEPGGDSGSLLFRSEGP